MPRKRKSRRRAATQTNTAGENHSREQLEAIALILGLSVEELLSFSPSRDEPTSALPEIFDAGGEVTAGDAVLHLDGIRVSKQPDTETLRRLQDLGADLEKLRSLPPDVLERLLADLMKPLATGGTGNVATGRTELQPSGERSHSVGPVASPPRPGC